MLGNATNLTNTTACLGIWRGFWLFLSDYWQVLSVLIGILSIISVVIGMVFRWYLQRKQHEHEREMEKLRQEYDEKIRQQPKQIATDRLKSRLERFVSCWEENKESILEREEEREKKLRGIMFWIGNELKEEIKEDEKLVSLTISEGVNDIGDKIITHSHQIARRVIIVNENVEITKRINQKKIEEGDTLIERAKEIIKILGEEKE